MKFYFKGAYNTVRAWAEKRFREATENTLDNYWSAARSTMNSQGQLAFSTNESKSLRIAHHYHSTSHWLIWALRPRLLLGRLWEALTCPCISALSQWKAVYSKKKKRKCSRSRGACDFLSSCHPSLLSFERFHQDKKRENAIAACDKFFSYSARAGQTLKIFAGVNSRDNKLL